MIREQEISKVALEYANEELMAAPYDAFMAGAEWADETMINKACEWMDCYIDNYLFIDAENKAGIKWDDFINDFKQAMKGE